MDLARADRRFAVWLGVGLAVWAVYALAVRGPLRAARRREEKALRARDAKLTRYFRDPKATELARVQAELAGRFERLEGRLATLRTQVEFAPGELDPAGIGADPSTLYFKLSEDLHKRLELKAGKVAHLVSVPKVFDPQGEKRTPSDAATLPRLHRQLVMAYRILDTAVDHRLDVAELRAPAPRVETASGRAYLDEASVIVRASGPLDALAAWLHTLGQPQAGNGGGRFLSVGSFELGGDADAKGVEYRVTFVSVRANPAATLVGASAKPDGKGTGRRRPWRAPIY